MMSLRSVHSSESRRWGRPCALLVLLCLWGLFPGCGGSGSSGDGGGGTASPGTCGTCHGMPPPPPHTTSGVCGNCHGMVVDNTLRIIDPSLHANGQVDVDISGLACFGCHGSIANAAPPTDTLGRRSTAEVTVGAHQAHLGESTWHRTILCSECHVVPLQVDDEGHLGDAPAELTWGALARANGAAPLFDRNDETCSAVYCHGATLPSSGTNTEPTWTVVDGTQAACGTCHGLPPGPPHPDSPDCASCHGTVVDEDRNFLDPALHINGVVDITEMACNSCHGNANNAAPPVDTQGRSATLELTVGAHQAHLGASSWHREVRCEDCHRVPARVNDPGHLDAAPAELTWSAVARSDGASPRFDRNTETCSAVYCHGATLFPGGTNTQPAWTVVDGTQAACGTCHGLPPGPPHPDSPDCASCHGMVVDGDLNFVDPSLHINGAVEVADAACNTCHGNEVNAAPPVDTLGLSATVEVTVGAHQAHLGASSWHREVRCQDCHRVPARVNDPGHIDAAPAELIWSALARSDGASPLFDRNTETCSAVYCHGATLPPSGTNTRPSWTTVDGSQAACGACHGLPPGPPHPDSPDCATCHGAVYDGESFVDASLHIDGIIQVNGGCDSCHGNPPTPATESYPGGGGAHARHAIGLGYSCAVCHGHNGTGPTHDEGNGTVARANVDIVFDPGISFPQGTTMTNGRSPTESYNGGNPSCFVGCHNPIPGDTPDLANVAIWTDATIGCNDCHEKPGIRPPVNHDLGQNDTSVRTGCQHCHDTSLHLSGTMVFADPDPTDGFSFAVQGTEGLCKTCHDGGGGRFFGNQTPHDISDFWQLPASHQMAGYDCLTCHGYHGGTASVDLHPGREEQQCYQCHDGQTALTDMESEFQRASRHPVDDAEHGLRALECVDCHDPHTATPDFRYKADPDPGDAFVPNGLDIAYCLTCHDGGQGEDKTPFLASAHDAAALGCTPECHVDSAGIGGNSAPPFGPHASDFPALTAFFEENLCGNCHDQTREMSNAATITHHHVVDAEQIGGSPVECDSCHDSHQVTAAQPLTHPHTGELIPAGDVPVPYSVDPELAARDTGRFCLSCHDGSWPGAIDIAAELADPRVINSGFYKGDKNQHEEHRNFPNKNDGETACVYCHDAHSNTGTAGINRGRLLYDYMTVTEYPYTGKKSCGTGDALNKCH